jgi:hypothetical protein
MAIPAPTIDADLEAVKAALAGVQPRPGRVLLFGSRARGDARPDSDLDLLVVMPQPTLTPQERQQPLDVYAFPELSSASLQVFRSRALEPSRQFATALYAPRCFQRSIRRTSRRHVAQYR